MTDLAAALKAAADLFELHYLTTSPARTATTPERERAGDPPSRTPRGGVAAST